MNNIDTNGSSGQSDNNSKKEPGFNVRINSKLLAAVLLVLVLAAAVFYNKDKFVAATVDGSVVSRLHIIERLERQNGENVLNTMIEEKLIVNEAKRQNIEVTNQEIDAKLADLKKQIESQGGTMEMALEQANMREADLRSQILIQMKLEKLLGDKLSVTQEEIDNYIQDYQITVPEDQPDFTNQIQDQIKSEKFGASVNIYLDELKSKAKIKTYVNY